LTDGSYNNNNVVVLPPPFDRRGYLPPGIHLTTWPEFVARFGRGAHRRKLLAGLRDATQLLHRAGCRRIYVDGSFVTSKRRPRDFDACWDADGVNMVFLYRIAPTLLDFRQGTSAQKALFGGELFLAAAKEIKSGATFLDFYQTDMEDRPKGIVAIDLERWTSQ